MRHQAELASTGETVEAVPPSDLDDGEEDSVPVPMEQQSQQIVAAIVPAADAASQAETAVALPTVESLAGTAAEKMKKLHSQASILEARIAQTQQENEAKLARQKAIFEQKLRTQEDSNRDVLDVNANISAEIKRLKTGNANLRKKAKELEDGNHLKQVELQTLRQKLQAAESFISASLDATNDQHAKELTVLSGNGAAAASASKKQASTMFHAESRADAVASEDADEKDESDASTASTASSATVASTKAAEKVASHKAATKKKDSEKQQEDEKDSDDEEEDSDDQQDDNDESGDDSAESFVALSSKVHRVRVRRRRQELEMSQMEDVDGAPTAAQSNAQPQDLLAVLTSGVENLAKEEKASDAKLKNLFMANFKKGTKRHTALLAQQKALRQEKANLEALQKKLQIAVDHLEETKAKLKDRLRGLGLFLQRLGHLAVAPSSETQRLMKSLPVKPTPEQAAVSVASSDKETSDDSQ